MTGLTDQLRANAWAQESAYANPRVPTMLSATEIKMLEWLARTFPLSEKGVIVDAGSFLGGSTAALAHGLAANESPRDKANRIHSYDMFQAPNDEYSQGLIGHRPAGSSVIDMFEANVAPYGMFVAVHAGDFNQANPPDEPIDILFLDLAKSSDLNHVAVSRFFPKMTPGQTILIQQDHNDHSCPWVNVTMEHFADHFEYLTDDSASRVYLYTKAIPQEALDRGIMWLPIDEQVALAVRGAKRSKHPVSAYLSMCSAAWLFADRNTGEALAYLDRLPPQPWPSEKPYVEMVKAAIRHQAEVGHDNYIRDYFAAT